MVHVTGPVGGVELYRQVSVTSAPGMTGPDTFSDRTAVGEESDGERKGGEGWGGEGWGGEKKGGEGWGGERKGGGGWGRERKGGVVNREVVTPPC